MDVDEVDDEEVRLSSSHLHCAPAKWRAVSTRTYRLTTNFIIGGG